ncbi:hypothetical protein [Brenneria rubrifaciens]|uniref:Uncharacterized protein n=1 Tax=Brenneria rubrifaciens TaxID=55213 RepID=A0A4P8QSH0_9GAMM|nr:hypothetical protein [Brenneria rubrifaciens]QCR10131.1 hypothetical protein EH207_17540 [Brenneria rubrifaciens]
MFISNRERAAVKRSDRDKTSAKKKKCKASRRMIYRLQPMEKVMERDTQIELKTLADKAFDGIRKNIPRRYLSQRD